MSDKLISECQKWIEQVDSSRISLEYLNSTATRPDLIDILF